MMTEIINRPCTRGRWHSADDPTDDVESGVVRAVYHYYTRMLTFDPQTGEVLDYDIGHGSVSDQHGMNKLFRALEKKYGKKNGYYFSRAGGAKITQTEVAT